MKGVHSLGALLLLTSFPAQALNWGSLGEVLDAACGVTQGSLPNGMTIRTGDFAAKAQWVCQLSSAYGFLNANILNGDWDSFAKDVAGQSLGKLLSYAGEKMGSSALNTLTSTLNTALRGGYAQFKKTLYGSVSALFDSKQNIDHAFTGDNAGGLTNSLLATHPVFQAAQGVARSQDVLDTMSGVENAYKVLKSQQEAKNATAANVAQAIHSAQTVLGDPLTPGTADTFAQGSQTALSTREVDQIQVQLTAELMKQEATMHVSTMNQLGEQVQQQVMTNNLLMRQQDLLERQNVSNEEALTAAIEQVSQEIKTTADGYKAAVSAPYDGLKAALGHASVKLTAGQ